MVHYELQWAASSLSERAVDHTPPGGHARTSQPEGGVNVAVSSSQRREGGERANQKKKKKGAETMKQGKPKQFTWINSDSKSETGPSANQRQAWVMMWSLKPSSVTDCF